MFANLAYITDNYSVLHSGNWALVSLSWLSCSNLRNIGTKYFGGHSDLLAGILVVKTRENWDQVSTAVLITLDRHLMRWLQLQLDRTFLGNMMGSLESWLLLRSLRTLHLRVPRQSASATELAQWLDIVSKTPVGKTYDGISGGTVSKVWHSALQGPDERGFDPKTQMQGGWNATFAFLVRNLLQPPINTL